MAKIMSRKDKINKIIDVYTKYGSKYNLPKITNKSEYRKQYFLMRNKLKHFQNIFETETSQSASSYLYNKARTIERLEKMEKTYIQSERGKYIESLSTRSSGIKGLSKMEAIRSDANPYQMAMKQYVYNRFKGLIEKNAEVQRLVREIELSEKYKGDPVILNKKLTDFVEANRGSVKETDEIFTTDDKAKYSPYTKENDEDIVDKLIEGDLKP